MHDAAYQYVAAQRHRLSDFARVLELGGRDANGTVRPLFRQASRYVSVDLAEGVGVDVVANAATVELGETFDAVVSTELLEHTPEGAGIVANAFRHLASGGVLIATMAGPGRAPHGQHGASEPAAGEWYRNIEPDELADWLQAAGFADWTITTQDTDLQCVAFKGVADG